MLPERRKSAEEIAKLREAMGVPGAAPGDPEEVPAPQAEVPFQAPLPEETPQTPAAETKPAATVPAARSETRTPAPSEPEEARRPINKSVRSLRKSEQGPVTTSTLPRTGTVVLPAHRHSDRELMELRRTQAAPPDQSIAYIKNLTVAWPLVAVGYLLPLGGALLGWLSVWTPTIMEPDFPAMWMADLSRKPWLGTAGLVALVLLSVLGLVLAGWFAWKKPRSRHHAGFITIISVFTVVFAILSKFSPTHGP
ncbi:hypothetical protein [Luteolibacter luteus]|uniref:Uncharacterized protein n=1 Tax=Luteolibacter luteus TaxID=2728835 RepID=A0A858RLP9_9BACT|nr:hypothetical protein [Luteolibacter luteus]QJE97752.1 hypothetical protein HHL09_18850 [Luteolibacter luteus]